MDRELVIFWKHYVMSKDNLKKGSFDSKRYQVELKESRFPDAVSFEQASKAILEEYGERNSYLPVEGGGHQFAEITGWRIVPRRQREEIKTEQYEETNLL